MRFKVLLFGLFIFLQTAAENNHCSYDSDDGDESGDDIWRTEMEVNDVGTNLDQNSLILKILDVTNKTLFPNACEDVEPPVNRMYDSDEFEPLCDSFKGIMKWPEKMKNTQNIMKQLYQKDYSRVILEKCK